MSFGSSNGTAEHGTMLMSEVGIFAGKVTLVLCQDEDLCGALIHGEDGGLCIVLRDAASSADSVKASVVKGTTGFWGLKLNAVQCKSNCFLVAY